MKMPLAWITGFLVVGLCVGICEADLIAHYAFDEDFGAATAVNSAGNYADGTIVGGVTTGVPGIAGNSYSFDGINGYVTMSSDATTVFNALTATGQITVSQWLNWTATNVNNRNTSMFLGDGTTNNQDFSMGATGQPSNNVGGIWIRNRGPGGTATLEEIVNTTSGLNDGAWHQVAITFQLASKDLLLYIDGALVSSQTSSAAQMWPTFNRMEIGRLGRASPVAYYIGGIDDSQIYNQALTADQIAFLYQNPGQTVPNPIPGDFDRDGTVDGADFDAWQNHFNTTAGATLADGDADGDGDVDGADFVIWQTHYPTPAGSAVSTVPEPPSIAAAIFGLLIGGLRKASSGKTIARISRRLV